MTRTRTRQKASRAPHALRGETVSTVAVLAGPDDFARMRQYRSFGFTAHRTYLRRLEHHLAALARRGGQVRVALFEPEQYAEYCRMLGLAADDQAARARYTAEIAACGPGVGYRGQPVPLLLAELEDASERRLVWDICSARLASAGGCPECGGPRAGCLYRRAARSVAEVVRRAGPGSHRLVCSLLTEAGPVTAAARFPGAGAARNPGDPGPRVADGARPHPARPPAGAGGPEGPEDPEAVLLTTLLAAALEQGEGGGLVLRSVPGPDAAGRSRLHQVRGWGISGGLLRPLTEAEVFTACCTEPGTGDPVPPEAGVEHRAATELPGYHCRG